MTQTVAAYEMLVNCATLPELSDEVSLEGALGTSLRRCSWRGENSYQSLLCQHMCLAVWVWSPISEGLGLGPCGWWFYNVVCCFMIFKELYVVFQWLSWSCKSLEDLQATLG